MARLTAEEARDLARSAVDVKVDNLLEEIRIQATTLHKRQMVTGRDYTKDADLWINGGYSMTDDWKAAREILERLGYKVTFVYKELQFVDMYTLIEW